MELPKQTIEYEGWDLDDRELEDVQFEPRNQVILVITVDEEELPLAGILSNVWSSDEIQSEPHTRNGVPSNGDEYPVILLWDDPLPE